MGKCNTILSAYIKSISTWDSFALTQQYIYEPSDLTLDHTIPSFNGAPGKKPFENIVGKGENAGNQHFHLFPQ